MHYLSHLAELGSTNLHPHGRRATALLINSLDLQPGQHVLEIGCGTGETMIRVAGSCHVTVTGGDVLPEMVRIARRRLRVTRLLRRSRVMQLQPGAPLPFPDNSFDRVYMESVLGFQDPASAESLLAEIFRVLKPGGRYVANEAVWKSCVPDDVVATIHARCTADFGLSQASGQNWPAETWCRAMASAGFQILSADVLTDGDLRETSSRSRRLQLSVLLSRTLTLFYRLKACLSPQLVRRHFTYHNRLREHRADGQYIEARLFVLAKPSEEQVWARTGRRPSAVQPIRRSQ